MGFVFGLIGALAGAWIISEGRTFFGFLVGMIIGWLLHRLMQAQTNMKRLLDRVDLLEQRNTATVPVKVGVIISFLGVGVMLLVVGYFSPVPPKPNNAATE